MTFSPGAACATTALAALLATPFIADAAAAERSYELQTRMVEQAPGVGEYDGALQLRVSPDGIVSGYYRPDANPRFIPVSGGIAGDRFWIELGNFGGHSLRFSGTFKNGTIDAQGNHPILDNGRSTALELIATPKLR